MNVYYNWGRWIAHCPSKDCISAVKVPVGVTAAVCDCRDTELCTHGNFCGAVIPLVWPIDQPAIEGTCANRPVGNRNWYPGETIEDLVKENLMHGIEV